MVTHFIQNIFISIQKEDSKQSNNRKSNFKTLRSRRIKEKKGTM